MECQCMTKVEKVIVIRALRNYHQNLLETQTRDMRDSEPEFYERWQEQEATLFVIEHTLNQVKNMPVCKYPKLVPFKREGEFGPL